MRTLTCIVCPIGCSLNVEEGPADSDGFVALTISGNRCPRGAVYAQEEIRAPKRVVTATCAILRKDAAPPEGPAWSGRGDPWAPRRVPVKTTVPCPKEKIPELLEDIYKIRIPLPVNAGDTVIAGWRGTRINVIAVRTIIT
jgi:CxxC motif-containing protein